jgi:hypothetical protein
VQVTSFSSGVAAGAEDLVNDAEELIAPSSIFMPIKSLKYSFIE